MTTKTKALIVLAFLAILDTVIPIPLTALIVIYAITQRPPWVTELIHGVYGAQMSGR